MDCACAALLFIAAIVFGTCRSRAQTAAIRAALGSSKFLVRPVHLSAGLILRFAMSAAGVRHRCLRIAFA